MLSIRMQRTGRKGHSQFRLVVQDSRVSPTSGRVVAYLGSYDPHSKAVSLDKEKIQSYLTNGARPSPRAVGVLKNEGIKMPDWVKEPAPRSRAIRNADKLRRNRPAEEVAPEAPVEAASEPAAEAPEEAPAESAPSEEPAAEANVEEAAPQAAAEDTSEES